MFKKSFYMLPLLGTVSISSCMASYTDELEIRRAVMEAELGEFFTSKTLEEQNDMALQMSWGPVPEIRSSSPVRKKVQPAPQVDSDDEAMVIFNAAHGDDKGKEEVGQNGEPAEDVMTPEEHAFFASMAAEANRLNLMDLGEENEVRSNDAAFEGLQAVPNSESPKNLRELQDEEYVNSAQADMRKARLAEVLVEIEGVKAPFEEKRKAIEAVVAPIKARFESLESEVENRRGLLKARGENRRLQAELDGFEAELKAILAQLPAYDDAFKQADEGERIALINLNKEKANLERSL